MPYDSRRAVALDLAVKQADLERWAGEEYDRCHPEDTFVDLKRRSQFSKEARGLLHDWLAAAHRSSTAG